MASDPPLVMLSMTIMFVKSQCDDTTWMKISAIFEDGVIREKRVPMDGRILRIDGSFFTPDEVQAA